MNIKTDDVRDERKRPSSFKRFFRKERSSSREKKVHSPLTERKYTNRSVSFCRFFFRYGSRRMRDEQGMRGQVSPAKETRMRQMRNRTWSNLLFLALESKLKTSRRRDIRFNFSKRGVFPLFSHSQEKKEGLPVTNHTHVSFNGKEGRREEEASLSLSSLSFLPLLPSGGTKRAKREKAAPSLTGQEGLPVPRTIRSKRAREMRFCEWRGRESLDTSLILTIDSPSLSRKLPWVCERAYHSQEAHPRNSCPASLLPYPPVTSFCLLFPFQSPHSSRKQSRGSRVREKRTTRQSNWKQMFRKERKKTVLCRCCWNRRANERRKKRERGNRQRRRISFPKVKQMVYRHAFEVFGTRPDEGGRWKKEDQKREKEMNKLQGADVVKTRVWLKNSVWWHATQAFCGRKNRLQS